MVPVIIIYGDFMRLLQIIFCVTLLGFSAPAMARPISYPGGWTFMTMNDPDANMMHVTYSPTAKYSVGYVAEFWREEDWQFHGIQGNYLVKRWNQPASQANFYINASAGVAHSDFESFDNKNEEAATIGMSIDWEDRRYFTSYENRATYAGDIDKFYMQKARVGIAPYVGDFGDLHTWLMLEVEHSPDKRDEFTFTPLVRMFKGTYLGEVGVSDDGNLLLNAVIQF